MSTEEQFAWWQAALAGKRGPIYDGEPQSGFYRQRNQQKIYEPVAYWIDQSTGEYRCHINGRSVDLDRMMQVWPFASKNPITAEAYWHRIDHGTWKDDDAAAAAAKNGPDIDPETDPVGSLRAEIAKAREGIAKYKPVDSDEMAAKAQTLRSELTRLKGKAEKAYEAQNRPLIDQQTKLRKTWFPLRDDAGDGANELRKALEDWEDLKLETARKAEADRKAREAKDAAPADMGEEPKSPPPNTAVLPAPSTTIRGASGRAASVSTKKVVTAINLDKCYAKFAALPEVYNLFKELAQAAIDSGRITAEELGATTEEKSVVR